LNAFLAQCSYYLGKWKILGIIDEDVNRETQIVLEHWGFRCKNVDGCGICLSGLCGIRFEFKKASRVSGYSIPNPFTFYSRSYYAPFWYDWCSSSDHNITSCPFYACYLELDLSLPLA